MYDPKAWRSTEQIREFIFTKHHYRVVASCCEGAILIDDVRRTVHILPAAEPTSTKAWYLDILRQLDGGVKPAQTTESRNFPDDAYRRWAR